MEKKRSVVVIIVGWVIIISSAAPFLPISVWKFVPVRYMQCFSFSQIFTLAPTLGQHIAIGGLLWYIFFLISIVLGLGILRLNNKIRIAAIVISGIRIFESIFMGYSATGHYEFNTAVAIALVHIFYIYFLTTPKVKEQFR